MNAVAEKYAEHNIGSFFLYTHEAHPGEHYPHHTTFEQKLRQAQALRELYGVFRPILVDALDGACHRAYGSMPNMTWIFNRSGIPVYKSDWTDANSVDNALAYLVATVGRRRQGERLVPFRVERLDYRNQDRERFFAGLAQSGPKAVEEFRDAFD